MQFYVPGGFTKKETQTASLFVFMQLFLVFIRDNHVNGTHAKLGDAGHPILRILVVFQFLDEMAQLLGGRKGCRAAAAPLGGCLGGCLLSRRGR